MDAFRGKTAIITGGGSGIGKALGAELVGRGAHVVLADIDGAAAQAAAKELVPADGRGGSITGVELDVRDLDAVRSVVDACVGGRGRLDFMFNNAGISMGGETHNLEAAHWDRIIDVNFKGVVNGVLAAYPVMLAQGAGHIVNTSSGAGLAPTVLTVAYAATKHAVVGLSTSLRPEAARRGVRVSVLCPGAVDTAILDRPPAEDLPPGSQAMTGREFLGKLGVPMTTADRFARGALEGVAKNRGIIVVPASAKALWYLQRLSPAAVDRIGRLMVRRVLGS
jgi:NAD(P)-dependent dehydrogenase (short-subunit alcohol dehydrogenase family)